MSSPESESNVSTLVPIRFSHLYRPVTAVAANHESFAALAPGTTGSNEAMKVPNYKDQVRDAAAIQKPSTTSSAVVRLPNYKDQMRVAAAIQGPAHTSSDPATATVFLADALPVSDTQISGEEQLRQQQQATADLKKWKMIRIGAAVVLVVLIAVAVVWSCVGGDRCRRRGGGLSVVPAMTTDSARPAADVELLRSYFNDITLSNQTLRYPSNETAEERALQWLIEVDVATSVASNDLALVQRYALATVWFQNATGAPAFDDNAGFVSTWTTELHECNWQGVECDFSGQVNGLNLNNVGIRGGVPNDLTLLTALTRLDFYRVGLTGTIPSSVERLTNLIFLSFSDNQLSGSIPASLWDGSSSLSKLTSLDFYRNALTGTFPSLMALTDLTVLQLGYNRLHGTIPSWLNALTALVKLYLNDNRLSGTIPPSIGSSLPALTELVLSNNQLNGSAPFCNSSRDNAKTWTLLAADCDEVNCSCCTHCCLNGRQADINHFISC